MPGEPALSDDFREEIEYLADRAGEERARIAEESTPAKLRSPIRKFLWFGIFAACLELGLLVYFSMQETREVETHLAAPNPLSGRQDCEGESFRLSQKVIAYARANGGHAPETLQALIPTYLDKIPVDPLTLLPLKYSLSGNTFRIECAKPASVTR
jgi:hypothetical protein